MSSLDRLNSAQRMAAKEIDGPVLILAGAGTGKTNTITCRMGFMVERGISPDNILAVTFTNKAAREMQQRVVGFISPKNTPDKGKALKPTVCTFHSLCVRVLRRHIEKLVHLFLDLISGEFRGNWCRASKVNFTPLRGNFTDGGCILSSYEKRALWCASSFLRARRQRNIFYTTREKYITFKYGWKALDV